MAVMDPIRVDLRGRVAVVTGSNTGIGKEVARGLARLGAHVILGCRNAEKAEAARADIVTSTGNEAVRFVRLDQGDPASIEAFRAEVAREHPHLHMLVNNAGCWLTELERDAQGIERTFAINSLGYFRLTNALEPLLRAAGGARVVNVASDMARNLWSEDLGFQKRRFNGIVAYAQSKQANRMLSWVRAERLQGTGVTVNALHPGVVHTEISRNAPGLFGSISGAFFSAFGRSPARGADTPLWLACSPEVSGVTGAFFFDRQRRRRKFTDMEANRALWKTCEDLSK